MTPEELKEKAKHTAIQICNMTRYGQPLVVEDILPDLTKLIELGRSTPYLANEVDLWNRAFTAGQQTEREKIFNYLQCSECYGHGSINSPESVRPCNWCEGTGFKREATARDIKNLITSKE